MPTRLACQQQDIKKVDHYKTLSLAKKLQIRDHVLHLIGIDSMMRLAFLSATFFLLCTSYSCSKVSYNQDSFDFEMTGCTHSEESTITFKKRSAFCTWAETPEGISCLAESEFRTADGDNPIQTHSYRQYCP